MRCVCRPSAGDGEGAAGGLQGHAYCATPAATSSSAASRECGAIDAGSTVAASPHASRRARRRAWIGSPSERQYAVHSRRPPAAPSPSPAEGRHHAPHRAAPPLRARAVAGPRSDHEDWRASSPQRRHACSTSVVSPLDQKTARWPCHGPFVGTHHRPTRWRSGGIRSVDGPVSFPRSKDCRAAVSWGLDPLGELT